MTEIKQGDFYGKTLYVVGTDDAGQNIYELRGSRGALYRSERSANNPNVVVFRQTRSTKHLSHYGTDHKGDIMPIKTRYMNAYNPRIPEFECTDIDGPLVLCHDIGIDHEWQLPGYTAPVFDFI